MKEEVTSDIPTNIASKPSDTMTVRDKRDQYLHDVFVSGKLRATLPPTKSLDVDFVQSKPDQCNFE
jgi:hypothetical protein